MAGVQQVLGQTQGHKDCSSNPFAWTTLGENRKEVHPLVFNSLLSTNEGGFQLFELFWWSVPISSRRTIKATGEKPLMLPLGCNKGCASQPVTPSPLLASAATGRKNGARLLPPVHLQSIETLINLHAIEDGGRKRVTSTCN